MKARHPKGTRVKKRPPRAKKIDWDLAFQFYCEDMTRSYEDVAQQFGVAKDTIYQHSRREATPWPERRLSIVELAQKRALKRKYKDSMARDESHLRFARSALALAHNKLLEVAKNPAKADWRELSSAIRAGMEAVNMERVILGLPILIARSETSQDEEQVDSPEEVAKSARLLAENIERLEKYRNNG